MVTNEATRVQVVKSRDDRIPAVFARVSDDGDSDVQFSFAEDSASPWMKPGEAFGPEQIRSRVEPWLTALFQSEHLAVLTGSGLSQALHVVATGKPLPGMAKAVFADFAGEIESRVAKSAAAAGRGAGNLEDQIRTATQLVQGLEILGEADADRRAQAEGLQEELDAVLRAFATSILGGERSLIAAAPDKRELAFGYLINFLMSFASRTGTRDRLQIFTTNYDRVLEAGAEAAGLRLLDRFVGSLAPIFRSARLDVDMHYNPPGIRGEPRYLEGVARFTKLHGSLDWVSIEGTVRRLGVPFGAAEIDSHLEAARSGEGDCPQLMIYPNSSKDEETASYPYVELFRDFAAAICRPNSTLVTYGYGFGDDHVNRVIEDMLTIPSTHLVVISRDDQLGRIMGLYDKTGRHAQITLLVGDHVADVQSLVDNYLPKPAIDRATLRMSDLLRARYGTERGEARFGDGGTRSEAEGDT
jgi:hypothetical protein